MNNQGKYEELMRKIDNLDKIELDDSDLKFLQSNISKMNNNISNEGFTDEQKKNLIRKFHDTLKQKVLNLKNQKAAGDDWGKNPHPPSGGCYKDLYLNQRQKYFLFRNLYGMPTFPIMQPVIQQPCFKPVIKPSCRQCVLINNRGPCFHIPLSKLNIPLDKNPIDLAEILN